MLRTLGVLSIKCPECRGPLKEWAAWQKKCRKCGKVFKNSALFAKKPKSRDKHTTRAVADRHEKKAGKRFGMEQTLASGQTPVDKLDLRSKYARIECKTTQFKSFSVSLDLMHDIQSKTEHDKIPVLEIQLDNKGKPEEYCIVDAGWFNELLKLWRDHGYPHNS